MDSRISLDPYLIWRLTKLSKQGKDPVTVFVNKTQDTQLAETLKKKFKLQKKDRGYSINSINDEATTFATQLLSAKLLRKGHHNQVATHFIELGSQCAQGTIYNWATYLLNEFVEDCREAQDKGQLFHYAWLLILIEMEAWRAPTGAQFPRVSLSDCRTVRYMNLDYSRNYEK